MTEKNTVLNSVTQSLKAVNQIKTDKTQCNNKSYILLPVTSIFQFTDF